MKISLILQAVNRVSGPAGAATAAVKKLGAGIAATASSANAGWRTIGGGAMGASRTIVSATARAHRASVTMARDFTVTGQQASTAGAKILGYAAAVRRVAGARIGAAGGGIMGLYDTGRDGYRHLRGRVGEESFTRAGRAAGYLREQVSGLTTGFTLLKYASVAAGIGLAEEFVRGVFRNGGEMQQMRVTLERLDGGPAKAAKSLNWIQSYAMGAGARFEMPDILKAYQMAINFGMNPQGGSLAAFSDLAAGERVPLKQVLFAVKDAMEGTSTRPLANLGIKMAQGKGKVATNSYLYSQDGKFIRSTSAKTPEATLEALVKIINAKYSGLATAQANTVPGGLTQIGKIRDLFEAKVAGAGVFDWALAQMNRFFAFVRKASADGSVDRWAKKISDFMVGTGNKIIAFVQTTNWSAVGKDLLLIGGGIASIAKGLGLVATLGGGGISGLLNLFVAAKIFGFTQAVLGLIAPLGGLALALVGVDIAAWPITAIILAVSALASGAWLLYANWTTVGPKLKSFWTQFWADIRGIFPKSWSELMPFLLNPIGFFQMKLAQAVRPTMGPAASPMTPRQKWLAEHPQTAGQRAAHAANAGRFGGKLTIELTGPGASQAQVRALQATGMPVEVKRGAVLGSHR